MASHKNQHPNTTQTDEDDRPSACCCIRLPLLIACRIIGILFLGATVMKMIVLGMAYDGVLGSDCCTPHHKLVAGLVVGVVEVALFFLIGLWLTAAMFRHLTPVMFLVPLTLLICEVLLNTTLSVLMLVREVWVDTAVRGTIALLCGYSVYIVYRARVLVVEDLEKLRAVPRSAVQLHPDPTSIREISV